MYCLFPCRRARHRKIFFSLSSSLYMHHTLMLYHLITAHKPSVFNLSDCPYIMQYLFTESAHWADSVIESRCPCVCTSVCMSVPCEEDLSFHWRGLLHTPCVTPWEGPPMCHVSRVMCHVSRVTCHVSLVTCQM